MVDFEIEHLPFVGTAPAVALDLRERHRLIDEHNAVKILKRLNPRELLRTILAEVYHEAGIPDPDSV